MKSKDNLLDNDSNVQDVHFELSMQRIIILIIVSHLQRQ